ncbi:hypothetical protein GEMRC1_012097 [Eukaryota sp. GEM-RC1]
MKTILLVLFAALFVICSSEETISMFGFEQPWITTASQPSKANESPSVYESSWFSTNEWDDDDDDDSDYQSMYDYSDFTGDDDDEDDDDDQSCDCEEDESIDFDGEEDESEEDLDDDEDDIDWSQVDLTSVYASIAQWLQQNQYSEPVNNPSEPTSSPSSPPTSSPSPPTLPLYDECEDPSNPPINIFQLHHFPDGPLHEGALLHVGICHVKSRTSSSTPCIVEGSLTTCDADGAESDSAIDFHFCPSAQAVGFLFKAGSEVIGAAWDRDDKPIGASEMDSLDGLFGISAPPCTTMKRFTLAGSDIRVSTIKLWRHCEFYCK